MHRATRLATMGLILLTAPAIVMTVQVAYVVGGPIMKIIDKLEEKGITIL